jgi:hypothetical protein
MKTRISCGAFVYAFTGLGDNEAALTALEQAIQGAGKHQARL